MSHKKSNCNLCGLGPKDKLERKKCWLQKGLLTGWKAPQVQVGVLRQSCGGELPRCIPGTWALPRDESGTVEPVSSVEQIPVFRLLVRAEMSVWQRVGSLIIYIL